MTCSASVLGLLQGFVPDFVWPINKYNPVMLQLEEPNHPRPASTSITPQPMAS